MRGNIIPCGIHPSLLLIHYLFVLCCTIFYLKVAIKYSYSRKKKKKKLEFLLGQFPILLDLNFFSVFLVRVNY